MGLVEDTIARLGETMIVTIHDWGMPNTNAANIFDHKDGECIAYVFDDDGRVYFALELEGGVIAFEHIPENYPATNVLFFPTKERWGKSIAHIQWIYDGLADRDLLDDLEIEWDKDGWDTDDDDQGKAEDCEDEEAEELEYDEENNTFCPEDDYDEIDEDILSYVKGEGPLPEDLVGCNLGPLVADRKNEEVKI